MTATLQPELSLSAARLKRPLADRAGARAILDCEDWQLDRYLAAELLSGVLDIASPKTGRQELRLLVVGLEEHRRDYFTERTDAELAVAIFGAQQPLVRAQRVYARLNCHHSHFYDLAAERVIRLAAGSAARTGPGGSAVVAWEELVRFIKERRRG